MIVFYENLQRFDMSGRFKVAQRKFGWDLRVHPKKYQRLHGAAWKLTRARGIEELTTDQLEAFDDYVRTCFQLDGAELVKIAQEKRRRWPGAKP